MSVLSKACEFLGTLIYGEIEQTLEKILEEIEKDQERTTLLETELQKTRTQIEEYKNLVLTIGDTIPDMMWAKNIDGKYLYANKGILNNLFYGEDFRNIIGKTDVELSEIFKERVGPENHTFGAICGNSDVVVLKNKRRQRFLEWGKINGEDVYLEVYKAPLYKDNEVIGTVGIGRDVTEWYISIKNSVLKIKDCEYGICQPDIRNTILKELDKYKFEA